MMKKDLKAFFSAIRAGAISVVKNLVLSDKAYLSVCNSAPPKKDDGQSGLQVACKTGHFDIARMLIEFGADVNFMETSSVNEWTAPVLHDCIRAVIFNSYTLQKDVTRFDEGILVLRLMLEKGADPDAADSYGNTPLHRAIMDARQMIDNPAVDLTGDVLLKQLRAVFLLLTSAGADINLENPKRPSAASLIQNFRLDQYKLF